MDSLFFLPDTAQSILIVRLWATDQKPGVHSCLGRIVPSVNVGPAHGLKSEKKLNILIETEVKSKANLGREGS